MAAAYDAEPARAARNHVVEGVQAVLRRLQLDPKPMIAWVEHIGFKTIAWPRYQSRGRAGARERG